MKFLFYANNPKKVNFLFILKENFTDFTPEVIRSAQGR